MLKSFSYSECVFILRYIGPLSASDIQFPISFITLTGVTICDLPITMFLSVLKFTLVHSPISPYPFSLPWNFSFKKFPFISPSILHQQNSIPWNCHTFLNNLPCFYPLFQFPLYWKKEFGYEYIPSPYRSLVTGSISPTYL